MSDNKRFAVIRSGARQFTIRSGGRISVDRLEAEAGTSVTISEVLLIGDETTSIGTPTVEGATVTAKVVRHSRGPKLIAFKKKRRQGYKRRIGHRQELTELLIESING